MMTLVEYLTTQLGEEACEVAHICCKASRFGLDDIYDGTDNLRKLKVEVNDFLAVLEMLEQALDLRTAARYKFRCSNLISKKKRKVKNWAEHARLLGRLQIGMPK